MGQAIKVNASLIAKIGMYFVVYIASHVGIGLWANKCEKDAIASNDQNVIKKAIRARMIFKWYPLAYIVLIMGTF